MIAVGGVVALVLGGPLLWTVIEYLLSQQAPLPSDVSGSLDQAGALLLQQAISLAVQFGWAVAVAIPASYGCALVGLREIRRESSTMRDLAAPYMRPIAFLGLSMVLALLVVIPAVLWIVTAVVILVAVSLAKSTAATDPVQDMPLILTVMIATGVPFLAAGLYLQFRLIYAGLVLVDQRCAGSTVGQSLRRSWLLTRGQNGPLTAVALEAIAEILRGLTLGAVIGLFTRGMPRFVALFSGSYEVLAAQGDALEHC